MKKNIWKRIAGLLFIIVMALGTLTGCYMIDVQTGVTESSSVESTVENDSDGSKDSQTSEARKEENDDQDQIDQQQAEQQDAISEDGTYTSKEEVALYLDTYGHLPSNYITKREAQDLGWDSRQGNLDEVAPGMSIGGDKFGNREGRLPKVSGRTYKECDIDYEGGHRNGKRIVFSNQGQIYYTEDHYETFTLLYGEE